MATGRSWHHYINSQYNGPHSPLVLDNVTLKIQSGKTTTIMGSIGSGKTSILKLILGFYSPVSGEITIGSTMFS